MNTLALVLANAILGRRKNRRALPALLLTAAAGFSMRRYILRDPNTKNEVPEHSTSTEPRCVLEYFHLYIIIPTHKTRLKNEIRALSQKVCWHTLPQYDERKIRQ